MSQHDQVIDDGFGPGTRLDINQALAALFSSSSGSTEPTVKVPGQLWFDTSGLDVLKIRNGLNTGWTQLWTGAPYTTGLAFPMADGSTLRANIQADGGANPAKVTLGAYDASGALKASAFLTATYFMTDRPLVIFDGAGRIRDRLRGDFANNRVYAETLDTSGAVVGESRVGANGILSGIGGVGVGDDGPIIRALLNADRTAGVSATWDVRDNTGAIKRQVQLTEAGLKLLDGSGGTPLALVDASMIATNAEAGAGTDGRLLDAASLGSMRWESAAITIAAAGSGTVTHTLPAKPRFAEAYFELTAALAPFAIGDRMRIFYDYYTTGAVYGVGLTILNATQVRYQVGLTNAAMYITSAGANAGIAVASGKLIICLEC